eukprot:CAMPEP_0185158110 /NCGR_PEP_ID=MMETSP1139-20130426/2206_1 /TAXON_ID=298111 /ORGANISM="Pavlova sp., Strain CCMP459" /LENGTH=152 /DNA_ID=CAMNT_0027723231 /DNA_START=213 /DNA_END=669 /DNA_ORIENTATION=+
MRHGRDVIGVPQGLVSRGSTQQAGATGSGTAHRGKPARRGPHPQAQRPAATSDDDLHDAHRATDAAATRAHPAGLSVSGGPATTGHLKATSIKRQKRPTLFDRVHLSSMLRRRQRSVAATEAQHEVKGGFLLDVVVRQRAAVLELLAGKDEA